MSEFRYDPIKRTWVILAAQRGRRPSHYQSLDQDLPEPKSCPFCPGNEAMTPPEVYSRRPSSTVPDSSSWTVRVVPNKFPALTTDAPLDELPPTLWEGAVHSKMPGFGSHEIIIETPEKNRQMVDMESGELAEVLLVYLERMREYYNDERFKTVIVFKNHGKEAGASLIHSHTQLMALPVVPVSVSSQFESFLEYREKSGKCLLCDILVKETEDSARMVYNEDGYVVLAPFAAPSPFNVLVAPEDHSHDFSLSGEAALCGLAKALGNTLRRLRAVLGEHPWNMVLHNAPANLMGSKDVTAYHWFMEITPRLTNPAGFEMGSGISINTVAPEECAALLRGARSQEPGASTKRGNGETEKQG